MKNRQIAVMLFIAAGFILIFNPIPLQYVNVTCNPPSPCPLPAILPTNYNPPVGIGTAILGVFFYSKGAKSE